MGLLPSLEAIQSAPGRAILWVAVNRLRVAASATLGALALVALRVLRSR